MSSMVDLRVCRLSQAGNTVISLIRVANSQDGPLYGVLDRPVVDELVVLDQDCTAGSATSRARLTLATTDAAATDDHPTPPLRY
jgi:hypothetical protein